MPTTAVGAQLSAQPTPRAPGVAEDASLTGRVSSAPDHSTPDPVDHRAGLYVSLAYTEVARGEQVGGPFLVSTALRRNPFLETGVSHSVPKTSGGYAVGVHQTPPGSFQTVTLTSGSKVEWCRSSSVGPGPVRRTLRPGSIPNRPEPQPARKTPGPTRRVLKLRLPTKSRRRVWVRTPSSRSSRNPRCRGLSTPRTPTQVSSRATGRARDSCLAPLSSLDTGHHRHTPEGSGGPCRQGRGTSGDEGRTSP